MCAKPHAQTKSLIGPVSSETTIPVIALSAEEQTRRVEQAIAKRAYQIFEKRGGAAWHELEDWRQAESELHGNLCLTETTEDHSVVIGADPGGFAHGTLEIWAAPTQLTLSGEWHPRHINRAAGVPYQPFHHIFRSIELPYAVDPGKAHAHIRNQYLEIKLPQAAAAPQTTHAAAA
jgi:Molecular chaperone (small heat shock protein)